MKNSPLLDILIVGKDNSYGLTKDRILLEEALREAGFKGTIGYGKGKRRPLIDRLLRRKEAKVAIHIERVHPQWYAAASTHFLLPNQERFPLRQKGRLRKISWVMCKSRHAAERFGSLGANCFYTGFTAEDHADEAIRKDYGRFLHAAGSNLLKGTEAVLELWQKHPEWPVLTLVMKEHIAPKNLPANIKLISRFMPEEELLALQNACGIHLCPSSSEGWGHYIPEAMSCASLVITTDAPPMNEIANGHCALMVEVGAEEPRHLGTKYLVSHTSLEQAVEKAISMSTEEKAALGQRARARFLEIRAEFPQRLAEFLAAAGI